MDNKVIEEAVNDLLTMASVNSILNCLMIGMLVLVAVMTVVKYTTYISLLESNRKLLEHNIQISKTASDLLKTAEMYLSTTARSQKEATREVKEVVQQAVQGIASQSPSGTNLLGPKLDL